jgi:polar amino acid transport system permease protein
MLFDWKFALSILPQLARAAVVTIEATLLGFVVAAVLGLVLALLRRSENPWISTPTGGFIEFIRSTPVLIQIFFLYFVFPRFGIVIPALTAGALALGVHYACYCS